MAQNTALTGQPVAYAPDGNMTQQYAIKRMQRMQAKGSVPTQRPGRVTPPPPPLPMKKV